MNCPYEIAALILQILGVGTLRLRALAGEEKSERCFVEADHLHNLPNLLADYRPEKLRYYLERERPSFMARVVLTSARPMGTH